MRANGWRKNYRTEVRNIRHRKLHEADAVIETEEAAEELEEELNEAAAETEIMEAAAEEAEAEQPVYLNEEDYLNLLNEKKWAANGKGWLHIEINAGDLLNEAEPGGDNMMTAVHAVRDAMLEGDRYLNDSDSADLTVRYYCDNLSPERRKYSEVN